MFHINIDKQLKSFLANIFCVVGRNSPFKIGDFLNVLLDAVEHNDFINNTSIRVGGPSGETLFSRLQNATFEDIKKSFYNVLEKMAYFIKIFLRNRRVTLIFDTTDEPFYGKVEGLWIHPYQPVRGTTGCFKFLTVSCVDDNKKLILGSLPVRIGADMVALIMELIGKIKPFVKPEIILFDRGFDDYRLIEALQNARHRYQLLWRKNKWTAKEFKKMKRNERKEVTRICTYSRDKSKFKVKIRFVLIKKYRRSKKENEFNWVFATNTRMKSQHFYIDTYRKRWNIETTFRVLDNVQIKTTTKNEIIRFFINMFCCLIYNLWKLVNVIGLKITLKNFVVGIINVLRNKMGLFGDIIVQRNMEKT